MINIIALTRVATLSPYPVTLQEVKDNAIVDFSDDDAFITSLIPRAIRLVEDHCNISITLQRIQLTADFHTQWDLPYGPVVGIEAVDTPQSQPGSGPVNYNTLADGWAIDGDVFDPKYCRRMRITYTAGDFCPPALKEVIILAATFLYENRGKDTNTAGLEEILSMADSYKKLLWV